MVCVVGLVVPMTMTHAQIPQPSISMAPRPASSSRLQESRISLNLQNVPIENALKKIAEQSGLALSWSQAKVPLTGNVTISVRDVPIQEALAVVLRGTGAQAKLSPDGQTIVIVRTSNAQSGEQRGPVGTVTGRIIDSANGEGIVGVTVTMPGTKLTTTTGRRGEFTLANVPAGAQTVHFKLLGYTSVTRTIQVEDQKQLVLRVVLKQTTNMLSEVVTTATGVQRRIEVGNDITTINVDSLIKTMPVTTLTDLLATRAPGLNVGAQSGSPGAPSRVRIRGISSINATNDPIVIMDGIRMYAAQFGQGLNDRSKNLVKNDYYVPSPLDQIDPNIIETIDVFKGPSAVALYGTDAANGVIVITTKRGKAGPAQWSFSGMWGREATPKAWPENYWMWGHSDANPIARQCVITQTVSLVDPCIPDSLVVYQILNDSRTTVLGRGDRSTYRTDVSGGSRGLTYALSASMATTLGLLKMSDADLAVLADSGITPAGWQRRPQASESQSLQARVESEVNPKIRVSFTTVLNRTAQRSTPFQNSLGLAGTQLPETQPIGSGLLSQIVDWRNKIESRTLRTSNALMVSAMPVWNITTTATAGFDVTNRNDLSTLGRGDCYSGFGSIQCNNSPNSVGYYNTGQGTASASSMNLVGSVPLTIGRVLTLRPSIGGNFVRTVTNDMTRNAVDILPGATSGNGAATITTSVRGDDRSNAGVYLETIVGIANRLYFPLAIRQDAGSGLGNRVRPKFPKLSFSYVLSDEPVFKRLPVSTYLNTLRLRAAYGQSGVQPGMTTKLRTYLEKNVDIGSTGPMAVQAIASVGNSGLRPELTSEVEGGFDVDLFDDRFTLSLTWYRKRTVDALINEPLAPSLGYTSTSANGYQAPTWQRNIGTVQNAGHEISLRASLLRVPFAQWDANVGISRIRNTLLTFARSNSVASSGQGRVGQSVPNASVGITQVRFVEGYPLYGMWVNPITGWADRDGNGVITGGEVQIGDSTVFVGGPLPKFEASMHHTMTLFQRVTLGATFSYQNGLTQILDPRNISDFLSRAWNDPTTPLATQAYLVAAISQGPGKQGSAMGYVQSVSTLRFSALSVGYSVPPDLTKKFFHTRQIRISLQGTNLGLWTNYRGLDPNVNQEMNEFNQDRGILPTPRVWQLSLGIN